MKKLATLVLSIILLLSIAVMFTGCGKEFTVTFNGGGGTLKTGVEVQTIKSAEDLVAPTYEREGYTFTGWDQVLSEIKSATTVTALWKANRYTVTFNGNGGTYVAGSGLEQQSVVKPADIVAPVYEKAGYTLSWDKDLSTITEATEVKAIWTANKYKITFELEGGEFEEGTDYATNGLEVTFGQSIGILPKPTKQEKKFDSWVDENNNLVSDGAVFNRAGNMILSAKWIDLTPSTITYDLAGGNPVNNPTSFLETTETFTLVNPTKTGWDFAGWTGTGLSEPTMTVTIEQGSIGDRSYTATWTIKSFTVTLDPTVGGTCQPSSITVEYGEAFGTLPNPNKVGSEFKGWYYGETKIDAASIYEYETDITLVARYEEMYAIMFDLCYEYTNKDGNYEFVVSVDGATSLDPVYVKEGSLEDFIEEYFVGKVVASTDPDEFGFVYWAIKSGNRYVKIDGSTVVIGPTIADANNVIVIYAVCTPFWTPYY